MNQVAVNDTESRIPNPVFKFVEYKLYHYRENKAAIKAWEEMREDILQRGRQWQIGFPPPEGQHSPTEEKTIQMMILEQKAQRELFWIRAIEDVLAILPEQDKRLVELKYFEGYLTNAGVARELNMSERAFYDRREVIIRRFAIRFGLL
ncbi:MAG TPA: hypothetical protein GX506_01040 [Firmicutes bacterium]|nr:hypothetical protein [Bacillota bacterium]